MAVNLSLLGAGDFQEHKISKVDPPPTRGIFHVHAKVCTHKPKDTDGVRKIPSAHHPLEK